MPNLGHDFYQKLLEVSSHVGMKPEDLLNVMAVESGLNPSAHNKNGNASGLVQFMPATLKGLGYTGSHDEFRGLSGVQQLEYVEKLVKGMMRLNGGPFKSAAQYYVGNFVPAALKIPGIRNEEPGTIIVSRDATTPHIPGVSVDKEKLYYRVNSGLDYDKDGNITFGDIKAVLNRAAGGKNFQTALADMRSSTGYVPKSTPLVKKDSPVKRVDLPNSMKNEPIANLEQIIDQFLHMVAASDKQIYRKILPSNHVIIKVTSNNFTNSVEFARVLCTALSEELMAQAYTHTDRKEVEIECVIPGPAQDCLNTVKQLSNSVGDAFFVATDKIGGIKVKTECIMNKKSSYSQIDYKLAETQHRKFLLKFI